jgi:hypothetical protein
MKVTLLNVRAGLMGAVSNEPEHFWNWSKKLKTLKQKKQISERRLYQAARSGTFSKCTGNKKAI